MRATVITGVGAIAMMAALPPVSAAALPTKAPILKAPEAIYNWTGFYIGGNVGYSWGRAKTDLAGTTRVQVFRTAGQNLIFDTGLVGAGLSDKTDVDGWLGGGQIGYNV